MSSSTLTASRNISPLVFDISADTSNAKTELRDLMSTVDKLMVTLYGALGIMGRMGLPEHVEDAIRNVQRMVAAANMLRLTMHMLDATMLTSPMGWVVASVGIFGTALSMQGIFLDLAGY